MPEKKIADRLREAIRLRGYSIRTEKAYLHWYERFVRFHKLRHPATMGAPEIEAFLTYLAAHEEVSASTQNQALSALLFLYQEVLGISLGNLHTLRAKRNTYVQPYLSHDECLRILAHLNGAPYLVACFLYGSGLRLLEALRLRIQDLDFDNYLITVRDTKSNRDRVTFLPDERRFLQRLYAHLKRVRHLYEAYPDIPVSMPPALARKYPDADRSWEWQYVFPARNPSVDPRTLTIKRHHLHPSGIQRAITKAVRAAGITKRATAHTLRAAFAHRLKEAGCSLDDIQKLMGHADIRTTQHYLESQIPAYKRLHSPLSAEP
ncbi:MAG: integron integrase [Anaerolineae bacterium]|nr:integron integrase [Anaerolineae bacterium]MDW8103238.1 integron integrase [Anaerolineae bacterium]